MKWLLRDTLALFLSLLVGLSIASGARANGAGGYAAWTSPHDINDTSFVTTYAGRALDLTRYSVVYTDTFATGSGSTGVACDEGLETNDASSGSHNWFGVNTIFAGSNVHNRSRTANPAVMTCPISGMSQGASINLLYNQSTAQYEAGDGYMMSQAMYGPNYQNAVWKFRARFQVPPANLYSWDAIFFDSKNTAAAYNGYPANTTVPYMEVDAYETFPTANAVLTGTITAGSGYTNGVYPNIAFTGGTGTAFAANVTVSGGAVTAVSAPCLGKGFTVNDVLTTTGIPGGSGFHYTVNSVGTPSTNSFTLDAGIIQHPASTSAILTGHISAAGSGGANGTYPGQIFTGGTAGQSAVATVIVSGGAVTSVVFTNPGSGYAAANSLTTTISGLSGFTYAVDSVFYSGPPQVTSSQRGLTTYYSPAWAITDGLFHNYEFEQTPNWAIVYRDEIEVGRFPLYGADFKQPLYLIFDNGAATINLGSFTGSIAGNTLTTSGTTGTIQIGQTVEAATGASTPVAGAPLITAGSGTTWTISGAPQTVASELMISDFHYTFDVFQVDIYQCLVGVSCGN